MSYGVSALAILLPKNWSGQEPQLTMSFFNTAILLTPHPHHSLTQVGRNVQAPKGKKIETRIGVVIMVLAHFGIFVGMSMN